MLALAGLLDGLGVYGCIHRASPDVHSHEPLEHDHEHRHDAHHQHEHAGMETEPPHSSHRHERCRIRMRTFPMRITAQALTVGLHGHASCAGLAGKSGLDEHALVKGMFQMSDCCNDKRAR